MNVTSVIQITAGICQSRLESRKSRDTFGVDLPHWQAGLNPFHYTQLELHNLTA